MIPSQEEISAGQKAYQGLVSYERYKISQRSKLAISAHIFAVLMFLLQLAGAFMSGNLWRIALSLAVLIVVPWALYNLENGRKKNFELLRQLKMKYGVEIYDEIRKEPDSLAYRILQKSYPIAAKPLSVELP